MSKATGAPSASRPISRSMSVSWRLRPATNSSLRLYSMRTGRPVRRASSAVSEGGETPLVLVAEAAAHRRADHAHVLQRHAEDARERAPVDGVDGAAGLPDREVVALPLGQGRARLHANGAVHAGVEAPLEDAAPPRPSPHRRRRVRQRGRCRRRRCRSRGQLRRAGRQRLVGVEDGRQQLVLDLDQGERVFGDRSGVCADDRDLVADEAHDRVERQQVGVDVHGRGVLVGEDVVHAGQAQRLRGVDRDDAGVGVRAAQDAAVEHAGASQVGGVGRGAARLGIEADARRGGADDGVVGGHRRLLPGRVIRQLINGLAGLRFPMLCSMFIVPPLLRPPRRCGRRRCSGRCGRRAPSARRLC